MLKQIVLVMLIVAVLAGCATSERVTARNQAFATYWEKTGESYQAGNDGTVTQISRTKAPAYYQNGILINHRGRPVTFSITGDKSVLYDVHGASLEVQLAPGAYFVRIFEYGQSGSYKSFQVVIDGERGDNVINGVPYDFFVIAP